MSEVELTEVRLPDLAMASGARIARWMVEPGESVAEGQSICEIETDKVDAELPSPAHGYFLGAVVDPLEVVACGAVLCLVGNTQLDSSDVQSRLEALRAEKELLPNLPGLPVTQSPRRHGLFGLIGLVLLSLSAWGLEIDEPRLYWSCLAVAAALLAISLGLHLRRRQDEAPADS